MIQIGDISNKDNLYFLEYSFSQKCFHIEEITVDLERNMEVFKMKLPNDYYVLFIGTEEECDNFYEKIHNF